MPQRDTESCWFLRRKCDRITWGVFSEANLNAPRPPVASDSWVGSGVIVTRFTGCGGEVVENKIPGI